MARNKVAKKRELLPNNMFYSINNRLYGLKNINKHSNWCSTDVSSILENFEGRAREEYILASEEDGGTVPPLACSFCKVKSSAGHILALVDENGYLVLHNTTKSGPDAIIKEWQAHNNAVFDLAWMEKEEKLLTASGDQTAVLWDVRTSQKLETFNGHTSSIRSVAFRKFDDSVLATGSRDGHIMLWDKRLNHKDGAIPAYNTIKNAHVISSAKQKKKNRLGPALDSQQSVTVVTFQNENLLISAGAVDGLIKVWDLRKNYTNISTEPVARNVFPYSGNCQRRHGYSCLTIDSYNSSLYASCTDDVIYVYDIITYNQQPVKTLRGHKNSTFYIKTSLSPDDKFLLSGSSDEMAYIWQVDKTNNSPVILKGHNAEVTSVAWCPLDMTKVATISDDNTMRLWRINRGTDHKPQPGEVTGTAELTHREIGTSTMNIKSTIPKPSSPACSPAPKSILTRHVSEPTPTKSPSLKDWLSGLQKTCVTPQSLSKSLTKSKTMRESQPKRTSLNFFGISESQNKLQSSDNCETDLKEETLSVPFQNQNNVTTGRCDLTNAALPPLLTTPQKPSNKRKLEDDGEDENPSKRSNVLKEVSNNEILPEDKPAPMTPSCVESCKKNEMTPKYSPTQNLPNIVTDELEGRSPRTPYKGNKENSLSRKKLDWLTQIRLHRDGYEGTALLSPGKTQSSNPGKTQSSSDEQSSQSQTSDSAASPIRSKTPLRGKNSIVHYFQRDKTPQKKD